MSAPRAWEPGDLLCWNIGAEPTLLVSRAVHDAGRHNKLHLVHLFVLNGEPYVLVRIEHAQREHIADVTIAPDRTAVLPVCVLLSKQELRRDGLLTEWHDHETEPAQ